MNSTGSTCFTGCQVQMQRGGSKNLDTSALGHGGRGFLPWPLGATRGFSGGERGAPTRGGAPRDATKEGPWEGAQGQEISSEAVETVPGGGNPR